MDPFTIATSVTKITATCLVTGKTIYDLSCKYQDAPKNMVAISSEVAVISASLSQIQALILSKEDPESLLRSRPEIAATLDTALTGCMVLFSCLEEEVRNVATYAQGHDNFSWKGKMRVVWKHETFQELLDGMRGQQMAINTLIQLLQMDSLLEITRLLKKNAPGLQKTVELTQSLRHSHPQVKVAESIYSHEDRISVYSARDSMLASYQLDFDFDDIVINSVAYRRALGVAKRKAFTPEHETPNGDLIDFSDDVTIRQQIPHLPSLEGLRPSEDLLGLRLPTEEQTVSQAFVALLEAPGSEIRHHVHRSPVGPSLPGVSNMPEDRRVSIRLTKSESKRDPRRSDGILTVTRWLQEQPSWGSSDDQASPVTQPRKAVSPKKPQDERKHQDVGRSCSECKLALKGPFVRALERTYHTGCFVCKDCGCSITDGKSFPTEDEYPNSAASYNSHPYPLCETDYFKRLDLLCHKCGRALRGSYVITLGRKFHIDHFSCNTCAVVFGQGDSWYEHSGEAFCFVCYRDHAIRCSGCALPITTQFVDRVKDSIKQTWHPECHMIEKLWRVTTKDKFATIECGSTPTAIGRRVFVNTTSRHSDQTALATISRIWEELLKFEEKAANLISDILLHLPAGRYNESVVSTALFLSAVGMLFTAIEAIHDREPSPSQRLGLAESDALVSRRTAATGRPTPTREAKKLCKKCALLMSIILQHSRSQAKATLYTQELVPAVVGLAHYMKLLIRDGLQASLPDTETFLDNLALENLTVDLNYFKSRMPSQKFLWADTCSKCHKAVENYCFRSVGASPELFEFWHAGCVQCPKCSIAAAYVSQGPSHEILTLITCHGCGADRPSSLYHVTRFKQWRHSLWIGLARLMAAMEIDHDVLDSDDVAKAAAGNGMEKMARLGRSHDKLVVQEVQSTSALQVALVGGKQDH